MLGAFAESTIIRILLIEDSLSDARLMEEALCSDFGGGHFQLKTESNLASGLKRMVAGDIDLVLLDLNLPDSSGYDTYQNFAAAFPNVPVVVLTSIGGEEIAMRAMIDGAQDFLYKHHFDLYWIKQAIRHAMGRFRLLAKLKAAEAALRAGSEAKSTFLAQLSHDIRNPMTSILMAAEALKDGTEKNELADISDIIVRNCQHILELLNDILDLAKIEAGKLLIEKLAISPRELANDVLAMVRPLAECNGVDLALEAAPDLPERIITDPTRLKQILTNLVNNAIKFTPQGRVVICLGVTDDAKTRSILIDVTDNGCGITEEQKIKLFKPFAQADASTARTHGGTGLGLALSHKLAQALGGEINLLSSAPGQGSTFRVRIPVVLATATEVASLPLGTGCESQVRPASLRREALRS